MFDLVAGHLIRDLLQFVQLLDVLELDLFLLTFACLPLLIFLELLRQKLIDPGLVFLPFLHQTLQSLLLILSLILQLSLPPGYLLIL